MKKNFFFPLIALAIVGTGCKQQNKVVQTLDLKNLDTTVNPKDDFYQFACGGWMKQHPLTEEYARYGSFNKLEEENQIQLKELVSELANQVKEEKGVAKKIGTLYNIAMDSNKLNKEGYQPIRAELENIRKIDSKTAAFAKLLELQYSGVCPFFSYYVAPDITNSKANIFNIVQGGLNLPDRDYYLKNDEQNKKIRQEYLLHLEKMFALCGNDKASAKTKAKQVLDIETQIAKIQFSRTELRNPRKNFNKMTVADLQKIAPAIDWTQYFQTIVPNSKITEVNLAQVPFMKALNTIYQKASIDQIKAYYEWNIIHEAASYLGDDLYAQNFDFYGKTMSGQTQMKPRWKRAINNINGIIGEGLGQMYVKKYFPAEAKERMIKLVDNIKTSMGERFANNDWMSASTKTKAKEKLDAIIVKIGYPDQWRDYTALNIQEDSYWANVLRSNRFDIDYMIAKLQKPVDRNEWQMTPQTSNAYYDPTTNEICFPAGILQPPFFYMSGDDAINYGAIGVVIAHELTHGFDDQGRQFDKDGNLKDWWSEEDATKFQSKTKLIVDHFNKILVIDTLHANGDFTLGENIADNGGLNISFAALQKALKTNPVKDIDGFTPNQRFFLSYASVWAGNIRDKEIRRLTMVDPHSLGKWRVNGTLPHLQAFLDAFNIQEGDAMWLAPEKRARIW